MLGSISDMNSMRMNSGGSVDVNQQVLDLRTASEPFAAAFIEPMIPHHQMAGSAARLALQKATHREISELAVAILAAQQREIEQMQALHLRWYGSVRADMSEPTPSSGGHPAPTPMQYMPGMMDDGHWASVQPSGFARCFGR